MTSIWQRKYSICMFKNKTSSSSSSTTYKYWEQKTNKKNEFLQLILLKSPRYCCRCSYIQNASTSSSPKQMFKQIWSHHIQSIILIEKRTKKFQIDGLFGSGQEVSCDCTRFEAIDWHSSLVLFYSVIVFLYRALIDDVE